MAEVKINEAGFAIVPLYIKPKNASAMRHLPYKVDSGANRTTIGKNWLNNIEYDDTWIISTGRLLVNAERPTVATGEHIDNCYIVTLPEINIGGCVGFNWPFIVSLNPKLQFKLLFGTDSMQFFNWEFDYKHNVCRFDFISGKRELLFNQKEQSIHTIDDAVVL